MAPATVVSCRRAGGYEAEGPPDAPHRWVVSASCGGAVMTDRVRRATSPGSDAPAGAADGAARKRFTLWLGVITAVGLATRLVFVLGFRHDYSVTGDAYYYHYGADLLAHGHGFIAPVQY